MKCNNCGAELAEGSAFCTSCGTPVQNNQMQATNSQVNQQTNSNYNNMESEAPQGSDQAMGIISYISWIGFIVAIAAGKNGNNEYSKYLKRHLNNSLILNLFSLLFMFIPVIGWICNIVVFVIWLLCFINSIMGKYYAAPLFGKIEIFK